MLALLGSNGAGKTTIARVCSGLIAPTAGQVLLRRRRRHRAARRTSYARLGIVHAPEGRSVFASLTVAGEPRADVPAQPRAAPVCSDALDEAYALFPRLGERRTQLAGTLSGGEQRMLSLARVLVEKPRLLIADELSLGLAPIIVDEVYRTLETIRDAGTTLLIVEQHVHHALAIADDAIVLVEGRGRVLGPGVRARRPAGARARRRRRRRRRQAELRRRTARAWVTTRERVDDRRRARRAPGRRARSS